MTKGGNEGHSILCFGHGACFGAALFAVSSVAVAPARRCLAAAKNLQIKRISEAHLVFCTIPC
jgi:hypothetical protein